MSTPQTTIYICSGVRLDNRYVHSIYFGSSKTQMTYFAGKVVRTFTGYSYCRKSWSIKVDAKLEDARKWNYLYFNNTPTGKTWFYFINQVEYVNDNTVELSLELDVIQTYICDVRFNPCYVERQHSISDSFGANEVDEGLDVGELSCYAYTDSSEIEDLCILMMANFAPMTTSDGYTDKVFASRYNKVFGALAVFATPIELWDALGAKLSLLSDAGKIDGIVTMWMYPKRLVTLAPDYSWDDPQICMGVSSVVSSQSDITFGMSGAFPGTNRPKNMKTLQFPFNFLQVSNNQGGSAVYRFERFSNLKGADPFTSEFKMNYTLYGAYSPDATVKMVFNNYNMMPHETAITIGNYPTCAWSADTYKIWLAQNQNQHKIQGIQSGLTITAGLGTAIGGIASGNPIMAGAGVTTAISGATQIASLNAQKKDMSIQPPQARGTHSVSVNIAEGKQCFTFYHRKLTNEQMKIVDDFFTMYGYAVKQVTTPNPIARHHYTYLKTVDCSIVGDMCNEDRVKFENIIDRGITFWTDGDNIGNYALDNKPLL